MGWLSHPWCQGEFLRTYVLVVFGPIVAESLSVFGHAAVRFDVLLARVFLSANLKAVAVWEHDITEVSILASGLRVAASAVVIVKFASFLVIDENGWTRRFQAGKAAFRLVLATLAFVAVFALAALVHILQVALPRSRRSVAAIA